MYSRNGRPGNQHTPHLSLDCHTDHCCETVTFPRLRLLDIIDREMLYHEMLTLNG